MQRRAHFQNFKQQFKKVKTYGKNFKKEVGLGIIKLDNILSCRKSNSS